jgi:hypothetical protein
MQLKTVPKDFIINMTNSEHGKTESNFLLHGLSIKNNAEKDILLKEISFELYANDIFVKQISYQGKALDLIIKKFANECTWLGEGFGARLFLGEDGFFNPQEYSNSTLLKSNQETGIFNEYFVVVYTEVIDKLSIVVIYIMDEQEYKEELTIPLIHYKNKNDYIFPLKGCFSTCGNYNNLLDHRQHYSMEFAVDMAQYNVDQKLFFKENMQEEDHIIYGKEILAIADGEVMDCYNDFPVTSSWDWEKRKPYSEKYGALPSQCGNYVSLKHANGEYSFYGHMIMGSVAVNKGDKVTQGQVIGKVGHTGMSNCPHLHFQLMDGPDFSTSRGLPCSFINIEDVCGNSVGIINENNLIVHTR